MEDQSDYVVQLRRRISKLSPRPASRHGERAIFIYKSLASSPSVFVRDDRSRGALQPPYEGPFEVLQRGSKGYVLRIRGREVMVSIDRLKPAFTATEDIPSTPAAPPMTILRPLREAATPTPAETTEQPPLPQPDGMAPAADGCITRSGRRVHFPAYLRDFAT
ncbi:uncharacterized protein LOC124164495 [Ischnura elegans]|uniref:uncharacterized protein LOC124164495 n=1 Tax=Ischnura elegans TaxID=197161 RepID=UPI001ED89204|nr:uncharacterized protein LOC124164495 [Ischnura elegans]